MIRPTSRGLPLRFAVVGLGAIACLAACGGSTLSSLELPDNAKPNDAGSATPVDARPPSDSGEHPAPDATSGGACTDKECGPAPGIPSHMCADGTMSGAVCNRSSTGMCGWSVRVCSVPDAGACERSQCGPPIPVPACPSGGAPQVDCVASKSGTCQWSVTCPPVRDAGPPTPGKACGGLTPDGTGLCAKGEYCSYAIAAICGDADAQGVCLPIPSLCSSIWAPVCGCDSKTYASECVAAAAGVAVRSIGACLKNGR